jgi:tetratricopeptide (TPR) repeat protein
VKKFSKTMKLRHTLVLVALLGFSGGCAVPQIVKDSYHSVKQNVAGNYYLDSEKYKEGIEAFQDELKRNPRSAEAHYFMGRLQLADNHPKEGLYHLKQAVGLSPDKADYHFWLGVAYSSNMESNLERKSYLRSLELDPRHVQALTYLGHNQLERFEYKDALNSYNRVLELSPDNASALYSRALTLNRLGKTPEERLAWKKYLGLYSSGPMAQLAVMHLNTLGDFQYRSHAVGQDTIILEKIEFEPSTAELSQPSQNSLNVLGETLIDINNVPIHIVAYQKNNKKLAELRAKSVKRYLLDRFPEIKSSRLKVSWFEVPEKIRIGKKTFAEDESINFFSAV